MDVELREITRETVPAICDLKVADGQHGFVAPNTVSIAEAHFVPEHWMQAVYADTSAEASAGARWGCCSTAGERSGRWRRS